MSEPTNYAALFASNGSGEAVLATVQSVRSIGSTSIIIDSSTNWPTGTFIATTGTLLSTGKLDPTTAQVFYGTVSGTTITITAFAAGYSDVGNAIGDVVVLKPTTEWANIVASGLGSVTQFPAQFANFVEPAGGVWSTSSGLVGSQTAGNVWYAGVRSVIPAVTTHTFTASKDTYVDFNPATSAFTYVAVTNGATEPAVTASNVRVAKVVTGSSAVTTISQTQYTSPRTGAIPYNPYKFSVYRNAALTSATSLTKISFDTKLFDTGANFDAVTTHVFTAPVAGFYWFDAAAGNSVATTVQNVIALAKNSVAVKNAATNIGSGNAGTVTCVSGLIQMAANDTMEVQFLGGSGSTIIVNAASCYFDGFLVSEN